MEGIIFLASVRESFLELCCDHEDDSLLQTHIGLSLSCIQFGSVRGILDGLKDAGDFIRRMEKESSRNESIEVGSSFVHVDVNDRDPFLSHDFLVP